MRSVDEHGSGCHNAHKSAPEPIAIVGMSCRLPGGAHDPSRLWDLLASGKSAWSEVPKERFNMDAFHDPHDPAAGTTNTAGAHFIDEDLGAFDADFFGMHPLELKATDPQQRLLLEIAYEAFEDAGIPIKKLWGSNTGVYVGQWSNDYAEILARDTDFAAQYQVIGIGPAISSNRVSYFFNLRGPSFTVDTGCSSSLVALHNAVQSLRSGETDTSFVGGVNLLLDPLRFTYQSKLKMFSSQGRSFSFDHRANGYGRGEGCAGLVLKRLSSAERDGDTVRAIIRNTVLNQDGRTPGISVPSKLAQEEAIRAAYAGACLDRGPDFVEAHGTGTLVGDPIELHAISEALVGLSDPNAGRLPIGSIKGNVGHTESAAGIAGIIKAVLMLEKQSLPPQANFERLNPRLLLDDWNLYVPNVLEHRQLKRISVNSFGYGGTNAHVILDRAASIATQREDSSSVGDAGVGPFKRQRLFILSAANEDAIRTVAHNLLDFVNRNLGTYDPESWLDRLAYTINRRSIHRHRAIFLATDVDAFLIQLAKIIQVPIPAAVEFKSPKIAYVFSGQGAQYYNMGRELMQSWPVYCKSLHRASKHLKALECEWDLLAELCKDAASSCLDDPAFGQPASTALQLALCDSLADLGVYPAAVAGHSSGEIAAAYAAGALSFENAMTVSYHRGRLVSKHISQPTSEVGAMLAVGATVHAVEECIDSIAGLSNKVVIACYNSPSSVTLSGDKAGIEQLKEIFDSHGIFNRILKTNGAAYHSYHMTQIKQAYYDALVDITACPAKLPLISSVTGRNSGSVPLGREYWTDNLISPVRFSEATAELCQNVNIVLELGAHGTLGGPIRQTIKTLESELRKTKYLSCLNRKTDAASTFLASIGELFSDGVAIDLHRANNAFRHTTPPPLNDLPRYPFDHSRRYWHESRISKEYKHRRFLPHELLGNMYPGANHAEPSWRRYLRLKEVPWLSNHIVQGQVVFPAAGYLTMALEAIRRHTLLNNPNTTIDRYVFRNVSFGKALIVSDDKLDNEITLSLTPESRTAKESWSNWMEFRIYTVADGKPWAEHCRGRISVTVNDRKTTQATDVDENADRRLVHQARSQSLRHVSPSAFYNLSRRNGIEWHKPFDNIIDIWTSRETAMITIESPKLDRDDSLHIDSPYVIHPGTLDTALFHGICVSQYTQKKVDVPIVPSFISELVIMASRRHTPTARMLSYSVEVNDGTAHDLVVNSLTEGREQFSIRARGIALAKLPGVSPRNVAQKLAHELIWVPYSQELIKKRTDLACKKHLPNLATHEEQQLDRLVRQYCKTTLMQISHDQVAPGHQQFFYQWMQDMLFIPNRAFMHKRLDTPFSKTSSSLSAAEEAIKTVGSNALAILNGSLDPSSLKLRNGSLLMSYVDIREERCHQQIKAYCRELGMQNPALRILEIAGGSASSSLPILQTCNGEPRKLIARYDFTDISPASFDIVRQTLDAYSDVVNFRILDIEGNIAQQGFEKESYDIVIASNVFHATVDLDASLDHVKSLLRRDGRLIITETTNPQTYQNFVSGAFPGWWAATGKSGNRLPLLRSEQWTKKLVNHGFDVTGPIFGDTDDNEKRTISVFTATIAEETAGTELLTPLNVIGLPSWSTAWSLSELTRLFDGRDVININLDDTDAMVVPPRDCLVVLPEVCDALATTVTPTLFQALQRQLISSKVVVMLSRGGISNPNAALAAGFARSFRLEHSNTRFVTLDLDSDTKFKKSASIINQVLRSPATDLVRSARTVECEFAERDGQLYVPRVFAEDSANNYIRNATGKSSLQKRRFLTPQTAMRAEVGTVGLLETFHWTPCPAMDGPLAPDTIRVQLKAASINFRDVLVAIGQVQNLTEMKNDFSGIVVACGENMKSRFNVGDRVCGYWGQAYSNYPIADGDRCTRIPDDMTYEVAASLPIVWGTVYYSLVDIAHLCKGESILIHSGAGAVGQAAIAFAQHLGATIFTTVGSEQKRAMLAQKFGIPIDHIFSSRDTGFKQGIKELTNNRGVDVVLNSLTGDMTRESCELLADFGRFVEIGKKDLADDALLPTKFLLRNITFACVDLEQLVNNKMLLAKRLLEQVVELVASGVVKTVDITTYPITEIEHAFRFVASGKHVGKVILTVADDEVVKASPPAPPVAQLLPDATYVVIGGLGGLGRCIVTWLADRGARSIVTISRSGAVNEQAVALIREMESRHVSVAAMACDISSRQDLQTVVSKLRDDCPHLPVRGLINSAMCLQDVTFKEMTYEQWQKSLQPKVQGTWNLHECFPKDLDFFILLSSVVAISGNPGQTNYGAACSFQDSFAAFRQASGLNAYSINIGPVSDAGFVSENEQVNVAMERKGFSTVSVAEVLANLDYIITSAEDQCQNSLGLLPARGDAGRYTWFQNKRLIHLAQDSGARLDTGEGSVSDDAQDSFKAVSAATTAKAAEAAVQTAILQQLSKLLLTPIEHLSPKRTLDSYGVDSLLAVELKNWIATYLQADIPLLVLRETNDIQHLAELATMESRLVSVD